MAKIHYNIARSRPFTAEYGGDTPQPPLTKTFHPTGYAVATPVQCLESANSMALDKHANPIELFQQWFEDARQTGLALPDATTLATCDQQCRPTARMVLLKGVDEHGFVFYTNMESPKAHHLANNPHAALCFYWEPLRRQVRVEGMVSLVSPEQADAYFESRDRKSKIGAWASKQSRPLGGRYDLEKRVAYYATKFAVGKVQRPDFWSGYCLEPRSVEFWIERPFRLHERLRFTRASEGWEAEWLFP